jgi:hypothetical protein
MNHFICFAFVVTMTIFQSCNNETPNNQFKAMKDFSFDGKISEEVLKNYLSRSMTLSFISAPFYDPGSDIRMILNTGAKYISRAIIPWQAETEYVSSIASYKREIDEIHKLDPDIIIESCIFETVWKSCENTPIPDWVFTAFGRSVEHRNFSYQAMLFPNGRYVNHWGEGGSVPDISQQETQMYFYYRACRYIDAGFEGIHWGQVELMGEADPGYQSFYKLLAMVRQYAVTHARRHFILNNGHTHGIVNASGDLLFDFHSYPMRIKTPENSVNHPPSESNPQEAVLQKNYLDAIYNKSVGGKTPSGWTCNNLPYFVEFDNYGGYLPGSLHDPDVDYWPWGMDEISWFANQPASYRATWLQYAYSWVRNADAAGFLCMPGSRPIYSIKKNAMTWYHANIIGYNDENAIKSVWANDKQ